MNATEEGAARAQIAQVLAVFNNCADRGRLEEGVSAFTEDADYVLPERALSGRNEIFGFLSAILERSRAASGTAAKSTDTAAALAGSRHHLTTSRIEFSSDTEADGWTYFFVMRRGAVFQEGLYVDRFRRTGDDWRIAKRRLKVIWSDPSAAA